MGHQATRRDFLAASAALAATRALAPPEAEAAPGAPAGPIKVVVWDERQPAQKQAYENFLGNQIAGHLQQQPGMAVRSVALDDPDHGLSPDVLDRCRVLIWWGHVRQAEIAAAVGKDIVRRIKDG